MKILPAIDIRNKKCVRLVKGDFSKSVEYFNTPLDQAKLYERHGFKNLHIVDLDGARKGNLVHFDIIAQILSTVNLEVEIGGGIRNLENIKKYIDLGAEKVILGTAAIKDKNFLKEACNKFKNKIALGLDARSGFLSINAWSDEMGPTTLEYLRDINNFGVSRIIYTDINLDGTKLGPNYKRTEEIAKISNCPVIISGGVGNLDHIKKAKEFQNKNIEGIIVGKAIYDEKIKLDDLAKEIDA